MHPLRCITSVCIAMNQCACVEETPSGKSPSQIPKYGHGDSLKVMAGNFKPVVWPLERTRLPAFPTGGK